MKSAAFAVFVVLPGCIDMGGGESAGSLSGPGAEGSDGDTADTDDEVGETSGISADASGPGGETDTSGDTDGDDDSDTDGDGGTDGDPPDVPSPEGWPIGLPYPDFGVDETVESVHGDAGHYTHYVDNTAACDDGGPGTEANPRCTLPLSGVAGGDVVFVAAGTYSTNDVDFALTGSADAPIFFRGPDEGDRPVIEGPQGSPAKFDFTGSYVIMENLELAYARTRVAGDHVALRSLRVHDSDKTGVSLGGSDMVLINSEVDHHQTANRIGVGGGCGAQRIWVVANHIHHNAEDSIQFGHGCEGQPPEHIYIGANLMHSDRENAVDFKWVRHVIVSQNEMYGYVQASAEQEFCYDDESRCDPPGYHSSGSDGTVAVIGSDGVSEDVWLILNNMYDAAGGVRNEESVTTTVYANLIHDVGRGLQLDKQGTNVYFLNNVVATAEVGVNQNWRENFTLHIVNNIFSGVASPVIVESGDVASASALLNNLFFNDGSAMSIEWAQPRQIAADGDFGGMPGNVADNVVANPMLGNDFNAALGSPAIGAGTPTVVEDRLTEFEQTYGPTIAVDYLEADRPAGPWDIGAYEN